MKFTGYGASPSGLQDFLPITGERGGGTLQSGCLIENFLFICIFFNSLSRLIFYYNNLI